jgi:hypothetical protein
MRRTVALAVTVLVTAAGCTGRPAPVAAPTPTAPSWVSVALPSSGTDRPVVRDLAACADRWYAAGGYTTPDGQTRPGLWTSADTRVWSEVPVRPITAYGPSQLLTSVACDAGLVVAIGAASGGAHGNPRISTWAGAPGGPLDEQASPFELFGGPDAVGVSRLIGGGPDWLIVGAWQDANGRAGAAVWIASDGRTFRRIDADPALESDTRGPTVAQDAAVGAAGFTLVGSVGTPSGRAVTRDPVAWTSADGSTWQRLPERGTGEDEELQRVLVNRGGTLAVGVRGNGFGAWRGPAPGVAGDWRAVTRFGGFAGTGLPLVTGLAAGPNGEVYAIVGDGAAYQLWTSTDGSAWTRGALPAAVPVGAADRMVLAGGDGRLLLAAEDGSTSRVWVSG